MSKYVKNLISEDIAKQLSGESDCLLVNVIGLDANNTMTLRRELRSKNIHLSVVKNSLARRATQGTPLEAAFESVAGPIAVVWEVKTSSRWRRRWFASPKMKHTRGSRPKVE